MKKDAQRPNSLLQENEIQNRGTWLVDRARVIFSIRNDLDFFLNDVRMAN